MAGFYLHIPFCRKACHYCDFHFSTQLSKIDEMVAAMKQEVDSRASDWSDTVFETIYLGGGTPSLLSINQLRELIDHAYDKLAFSAGLEFTLECNPRGYHGRKAKSVEGARREQTEHRHSVF